MEFGTKATRPVGLLMNTSSKTVRTMCPMNCHPTLCGMKVTVDGGTVTHVEGDVDNPDSKGFLCVRGRASKEVIGNAERLTQPMMRNKRGEDSWRTVSWDEALSAMAAQLHRTEPSQFGIWNGHGDAATNMGTRAGGLLGRRFAHLFGSQWWHPAMICWGLGGFGLGITGVLEVNTKEDISDNADLVILWGANIASQPNTGRHLKLAKARGARVVSIDVRDSEAQARSDLHLRITPGADAALALAMMNVIVRDNLTNAKFIAEHTTGFEELKVHLVEYTPEWAAEHTGLTPEAIETLAHDYATTPRAVIVMGGSSMHKGRNGWHGSRAIACLPALTGKLGIAGGGLGERHGATTHGQALNTLLPDTPTACKHVIPDQMAAMLDAFESGNIKTLLLNGTNMLSSFSDTNRLRRGLAKLDMIVCIDLFMNDTIREQADIVLPATAWLEQLGAKMTHTHLYLMPPILEPAGECRTFSQIMRGLASKLDLRDYYPWKDDEEMFNALFDHPCTGHATIADLRKDEGIRPLRVSKVAYPTHEYSTPSGQVEFYSSRAEQLGLPALPVFTPAGDQSTYPLAFRQGRTLTHFHAFYDHGAALPTLKKRRGEPTLWVAQDDATARGIGDGDPIRIYNQRGECRATARITHKISPGAVWMRDGWPGVNNLTDGDACLPDGATSEFPFGVGQSLQDAQVEVAPATPSA
jgi:anaerobic selenocysteine-containing dehydrogenase